MKCLSETKRVRCRAQPINDPVTHIQGRELLRVRVPSLSLRHCSFEFRFGVGCSDAETKLAPLRSYMLKIIKSYLLDSI
jgi:hypothetical protein